MLRSEITNQRSQVGGPVRPTPGKGGFALRKQRGRRDGFTLPAPRACSAGFTLAEMLVATAVLALLVVFVTQLVNHAAAVVTQGTKHMETESHVRPLFDRLAVDIAQMAKRNDVSCFLKNAASGSLMGSGSTGVNDRLAFFSAVPGYFNDNDSSNTIARYNSRYSVVAYRINADPASTAYNRSERMAKGLFLNGAYSAPIGSNDVTPLLFLAPAPGSLYTDPDSYNTTIDTYWPAATRPFGDPAYNPTDNYQKYELVSPQVFRFEYYYLTKLTPALVAYPSGTQLTQPTDATGNPYLNWTTTNRVNVKDVAAIIVAVAAIDPQSRKLLSDTQIATLTQKLTNYTFVGTSGAPAAGWLLGQWQNMLNTDATINAMPRPAIQGIRFYERYFYLSQ